MISYIAYLLPSPFAASNTFAQRHKQILCLSGIITRWPLHLKYLSVLNKAVHNKRPIVIRLFVTKIEISKRVEQQRGSVVFGTPDVFDS